MLISPERFRQMPKEVAIRGFCLLATFGALGAVFYGSETDPAAATPLGDSTSFTRGNGENWLVNIYHLTLHPSGRPVDELGYSVNGGAESFTFPKIDFYQPLDEQDRLSIERVSPDISTDRLGFVVDKVHANNTNEVNIEIGSLGDLQDLTLRTRLNTSCIPAGSADRVETFDLFSTHALTRVKGSVNTDGNGLYYSDETTCRKEIEPTRVPTPTNTVIITPTATRVIVTVTPTAVPQNLCQTPPEHDFSVADRRRPLHTQRYSVSARLANQEEARVGCKIFRDSYSWSVDGQTKASGRRATITYPQTGVHQVTSNLTYGIVDRRTGVIQEKHIHPITHQVSVP